MAIAGTLLSYLYYREVQAGDSISLEPAEPSASNANKRDEAGDEDDEEGILECNLSSSDEDSSHGE